MEKKNVKLAVVGGGAAGLMAAVSASEKLAGQDIVIIEKNRIAGRKIYATGNGRCNYSNMNCSWQDYSKRGAALVEAVFDFFGPEKSLQYFKDMGIYPRRDEEGRVYPYSLQASSLVDAFLEKINHNETVLSLGNEVQSIDKTDHGFEIECARTVFACEKIILTTGGKAGLKFGSTGDGYGFARHFGHSLISPRPALVKIVTKEGKQEKLKGIRVKGQVSLLKEQEMIAGERGEIQFYEEGLSGISVFELSRHMEESGKGYSIKLDLFPDHSEKEMAELLLDRKEKMEASKATALLRTMVNDSLIPIYLKGAKITEEEVISNIEGERIISLANLLKERIFTVEGTKGWMDAQVTAGGVNTDEVDITLESKLVPGLFFAGEILDVDGPCGGWNLQWAWSSGYVAGFNAAGR